MNDLLRHRLNVEGSGQANSTNAAADGACSAPVASAVSPHGSTSEQAAPLRIVRIIDVYPVGVLSDEVAVAALDCGHTAFDVDDDQLYAVCAWCPWEGVL